jgi:hypothetical protein
LSDKTPALKNEKDPKIILRVFFVFGVKIFKLKSNEKTPETGRFIPAWAGLSFFFKKDPPVALSAFSPSDCFEY